MMSGRAIAGRSTPIRIEVLKGYENRFDRLDHLPLMSSGCRRLRLFTKMCDKCRRTTLHAGALRFFWNYWSR